MNNEMESNDAHEVYLTIRGWKEVTWKEHTCEACKKQGRTLYKLETFPFLLCIVCAYALERKWFGIIGVGGRNG